MKVCGPYAFLSTSIACLAAAGCAGSSDVVSWGDGGGLMQTADAGTGDANETTGEVLGQSGSSSSSGSGGAENSSGAGFERGRCIEQRLGIE